jgi:hypothetical protein
MRRTTDETLIRGYLLGDISKEERARVEDQYFANSDMFEELLAAENDLIDCYVRGELNELDRKKFEKQFLSSPQRHARVEFARALNQVSHQTADAKKTFRWGKVWAYRSGRYLISRWALAGVALVIVAAGSWLIVQNQRLRGELQQAQAKEVDLERSEDTLRQQIGSLQTNPVTQRQESQSGSDVAKMEKPFPDVTLRLTSDMARGGGRQNTLTLPSGGLWVRLELVVDRDEYASYQAFIKTVDGTEIEHVEGLRSQKTGAERVVVARFPSKLIRSGDYIVTLNGSGNANTDATQAYSLRVVRK